MITIFIDISVLKELRYVRLLRSFFFFQGCSRNYDTTPNRIMNEAPLVRAQSGSRIYQSQNEKTLFMSTNSQLYAGGEGGRGWVGLATNFQLLMLSPNLLKSPSAFMGGGRGKPGNQLPTFDTKSKSAKSPNSLCGAGGEGGGEGGSGWQPTSSNF